MGDFNAEYILAVMRNSGLMSCLLTYFFSLTCFFWRCRGDCCLVYASEFYCGLIR